ncbi:MAG: hypothetical protein ACK50Y_01430 [Flavobacteriia bacterium]
MRNLLFTAFIIAGLSSCKKFDEGGFVSSADKNLTRQTWVLDAYLRNGNDETSQLLISIFEETYNEDGTLLRSYVFDGAQIDQTGGWTLKSDTKQIKIDGVSSLQLTAQSSTVSSSDIEIMKLKKKEFWYFFENGSDRHEFHFVPKN